MIDLGQWGNSGTYQFQSVPIKVKKSKKHDKKEKKKNLLLI